MWMEINSSFPFSSLLFKTVWTEAGTEGFLHLTSFFYHDMYFLLPSGCLHLSFISPTICISFLSFFSFSTCSFSIYILICFPHSFPTSSCLNHLFFSNVSVRCLFPFRAPLYLRPGERVTTFADRSIQQTVLAGSACWYLPDAWACS
jgi:hypothetical protein